SDAGTNIHETVDYCIVRLGHCEKYILA
ncbi:hypothetical protein EVA_11274, partial [gut metagenome]